jgi:hypothetical protein
LSQFFYQSESEIAAKPSPIEIVVMEFIKQAIKEKMPTKENNVSLEAMNDFFASVNKLNTEQEGPSPVEVAFMDFINSVA